MCLHISYYRQTVSHNVHSFATKQQIWGNAISDCLIAWTLHVLLPMYWSWKLYLLPTFFTCVVSVLVPRSQKEIKFWGLSYKEWALVNNTIWYQLLSFPTQWRIDLVSTCFRPLKKAASLSFKACLFRDKTVENEQVRLHIKNIQSWVTSQKGRKNALKRKIKRKKNAPELEDCSQFKTKHIYHQNYERDCRVQLSGWLKDLRCLVARNTAQVHLHSATVSPAGLLPHGEVAPQKCAAIVNPCCIYLRE